ncbi:SixA phosphatase family protein [Nocardioides bizhenqiangii]|uniref:Histidine phosphatase family protein n=1 Tax=Nocardioides bizhenqiangii TaxID=3095076 RepID=A0ABZ0ZLJ1_9ACTN|nr:MULTISPECIES: histidine phosphatase family protein [unclassified Nocardioides]MDZ5620268.1 histidine phosphatase family protein [Nocardioides sp. HM23]WQQ24644.1 histidine phosphatase family protein [Nocardioides sp. HM61]
MVSSPHRLVVVRHAKAEGYGPSDFERELSARGRGDAAAAGAWLAEQGVTADAGLVSASVRTRQTWEILTESAGWSAEATFDRALYGADEDGVLDVVAMTDEAVGTLVVVGHNPTVGMLAQLLDDGEGPPDAVDRLMQGYPTSATAIFELPGAWSRIAMGRARLTAFAVGRGAAE